MKAYQDTFSIKKHKLQGPRIYLHYCLYTDKEVPAVTIPFTSYIHISFSFVFRVSSIFDIYIYFIPLLMSHNETVRYGYRYGIFNETFVVDTTVYTTKRKERFM